MWNLNYDKNEPMYGTETDSGIENGLAVAKADGTLGGWG